MPIAAWDEHDPAELDVEALTRAYAETLRAAAAKTDDLPAELSDPDASEAMDRRDGAGVTLADAAVILATRSDRLDADGIHAELLDRILIGMSNAVLDVETLASELSLGLSPKELQQRIEGRAPMTVAEYAHIRRALSLQGA